MGRGHRRLRQVRRLCERRSARAQDRQHCEVAQTEEEWHRREQHEQQQQEQQELRQEDPVLIEFEELARQEVNRVFNMLFDYAASIFAMSRGAYMRVIRGRMHQIVESEDQKLSLHRIEVNAPLFQEALNRIPVKEDEVKLREFLRLFKSDDLIGVDLLFRKRSQDPGDKDTEVQFKDRHSEDKDSKPKDKDPAVGDKNPDAAAEDRAAEIKNLDEGDKDPDTEGKDSAEECKNAAEEIKALDEGNKDTDAEDKDSAEECKNAAEEIKALDEGNKDTDAEGKDSAEGCKDPDKEIKDLDEGNKDPDTKNKDNNLVPLF